MAIILSRTEKHYLIIDSVLKLWIQNVQKKTFERQKCAFVILQTRHECSPIGPLVRHVEACICDVRFKHDSGS